MALAALDFNINTNTKFFSEDLNITSLEGRDFWRAFIDTDEIRELSVYSHAQKVPKVEDRGDSQTITYNSLVAENGEVFDITLTVTVKNINGMLEFSSIISNRSEAILNELQLPFVSAASFGVKHNEEVFYIPDGIGSRTVDPRKAVAAVHTEYMSADYKSTWMTHSYPPTIGRFMSMPWMGLQFGNRYLYFGEHNPEMRIVGFNIGISPRHTESELMFCISHYPAVHQGETVECGKSVMALFEGDWRDGAALYRKWSKETWYREQNIVPWAKEITGWQRVILKHQYGEIYFKYEDLPRLYLEGKKCGLNALMVFGWWKGRFDNNYPEYEPDPALGGAEKLKEAIAKVQRLGGHVILYSNGNLIDIKTDFYKKVGQKISHKDIDGNEYREHYQFSNDGTILRTYGYKSFDTACHRTSEWKDNLLNVAELKLSFEPDSIFFDQLGCALKLCFDSTHPHGYRIDEDGMGRFENICAIREITPKNVAIGTESVCDRYANLVDYVHGCGNGNAYTSNAYPDLYLHTFPGLRITNRFLHDDKEGFRDHLNYAFTCGLIFDVCIYRGRVFGIAGLPDYAEHVKYLNEIKEKYKAYFYHGNYESMYGEKLPDGIMSVKFTVEDGSFIVTFWNKTNHDLCFELYGRTVRVNANDVAVAEY